MSDWELLQKYVKEHSNDAMSVLVQRHAGMVHGVAQRELRDAALADDVTQAVFLVLMRRAKELSPHTVLAGWLFKTTMYAVSDVKKQRRRRESHEQEAARMRTHETGRAEDHPAAEVLHTALATLAPRDRDALILRYFEDQRAGEIAAVMGSTEDAVRQRISRALEKLGRQMSRHGQAISGASLAGTLETLKAGLPAPELASALGSVVRGAPPALHIEQLATEILKMAKRAKILSMAAVAGAAVLMLTAGAVIAVMVVPQGADNPSVGTASVAQAPAGVAPPVAAPRAGGTTQPGDSGAATPKEAVTGAYRAALAGNSAEFVKYFGSAFADGTKVPLTEEEKGNLARVAASMSVFEQMLAAVGEKFGPQVKAAIAKQMPMATDPSDIEKATVTEIDAAHAVVNAGGTGPGDGIRVVKIDGRWMVDAEILRKMNMAVMDRAEKQLEGIRVLTAELKAGKYETLEVFRKALAAKMAPPPATTLP